MIKYYVKKNCIPIIFEIFFIISCFLVPKEYIIYTNCLFYVCLFIFFILKRDLNLKDWFFSFKSGKKYWEQVGLTLLGFMLAFGITIALENIFPNIDTGFIGLRRNSWLSLIIFFISTIILPAVTEETFFRKNMILLHSKQAVAITMTISMFLYAIEHALSWWGILLTMIWAIPLSIAYIKTKNIYVVMTAHFIGSLLGNGFDVIFTAIQLI